jgi:L-iditol 2-dehydrogenase
MLETMNAAVLYGKEDVRVERVDVPPIGAGDLLVRVGAALTCGTDVKVFCRGYHARMIIPPSLFGHEVAGEVVAVGRGVTEFKPGDRVVASNSAPCGQCFHCEHGQSNLCDDLLFNNGAYAEYIRIPARIVERNAYHVPPHVSYSDAALMEPLACVVQGWNDTGARKGDTVTIIGLGPIGMMFVKLARQRGAHVIAVGRRKAQVDRALQMGASHGIFEEETDEAVEHVRALTGDGTDIAIEAVGKPELWSAAVRMLRRGGKANFFGGCPAGTDVTLSTELLHYSGLTCLASFHHTPETNREALNVISAGHVTACDFVGGEEPLSAVPDVLRRLAHKNGVLKTAIVPIGMKGIQNGRG